jgi:hypothetical protein
VLTQFELAPTMHECKARMAVELAEEEQAVYGVTDPNSAHR